MPMSMSVTEERLQRLIHERDRTVEKLEDMRRVLEEEKRDPNDSEAEMVVRYRDETAKYDKEIETLAEDLERGQKSIDASKVIRVTNEPVPEEHAVAHRTFAQYARDILIRDHPELVSLSAGGDLAAMRAQAEERLARTLQNTTSTTVAGLITPTYLTEILDIIDRSRPVVDSGRKVPLDRGSLTYPKIGTRPTVTKQSAEKTEAGTVAPTVTSATMTADTYLGATNISWQAVNWSNPDVMNLYFQLAAEDYARSTENAACDVLEDAAIGTVGTSSGRLGTAGTESYVQWRQAVSAGVAGIYSATSGRHRTNTLYLSGARFLQLATLASDQTLNMSPVGQLDWGTMTGTFFGMQVVGSYGFDQDVAIVGDSGALLIGENAGNPVEMRVIEPNIGGYQVGLIGAFKAAVFDVNRFYHLGTHL